MWPSSDQLVVFQETQSSAFTFQAIWGPHACAQLEATISTWVGALVHIELKRYVPNCYAHFLSWSQNQTPACNIYFCITSPTVNQQLFESALWNSGMVQEAESLFLQPRNGEHRKAFVLGRAQQSPTWFQSPFSLILLTLEGNRCWTRKGIRKVNHKLSRGILVYWDSHSGPLLALLLSLPPSCFFLIISFH